MSIYKLYPEKDTTLYTDQPEANTGIDEILTLKSKKDISGKNQTSRILIKFDSEEITNIKDSIIKNKPYNTTLNLHLAYAENIPTSFKIEAYPIYTDGIQWDNGSGKYGDIPINTTGVSWKFLKKGQNEPWEKPVDPNITSSSLTVSEGGGVWYTQVNGSTIGSQAEFTLHDKLDLSLDITEIIENYNSGNLVNNGVIIKLEDSTEQHDSGISIDYFSRETETIYPPSLNFKWDDSEYNPGGLSEIDTNNIKVVVSNLKEKYREGSVERLDLHCNYKYPKRRFTTSSIYLDQYCLPETAYWRIIDELTGEIIHDFDENYTKISCDQKGPYVLLYTDSLQVERFYKLEFKVVFSNSTVIVDDTSNIFKIE